MLSIRGIPSICFRRIDCRSCILLSWLGTRRIDRALDEAASIFNSTDPYSSKILFLLTTGRQAQESDITPFDVAIQPLIDMGTHTYVIAVGSAPSVRELRPLVDNPEDLFQLLFNMLQNQVSRIVKHTRKGRFNASYRLQSASTWGVEGSRGSNEPPLEVNNGRLKSQTVDFQLLGNR